MTTGNDFDAYFHPNAVRMAMAPLLHAIWREIPTEIQFPVSFLIDSAKGVNDVFDMLRLPEHIDGWINQL